MTDQTRHFFIRPYGDRWAIVSGDEVVLVAPTQQSAESVVATANGVLEESGIGPLSERRSFAGSED
ncbi:MAG TPA: hypothetical protein VN113_03810 [Caulobacter sp.]|nr:hypothetical protein [Caulobacter sp.]